LQLADVVVKVPGAADRHEVHARFHGANCCRKTFACPFCGPWRAGQMRTRLLAAICRAMRCASCKSTRVCTCFARDDSIPIFVTATAPHEYGDDLRASADLTVDAWGHATGGSGGRARQRWCHQVGDVEEIVDFGTGRVRHKCTWNAVRVFDCTIGAPRAGLPDSVNKDAHGWHPHVHAIIFVPRAKMPADEAKWAAHIKKIRDGFAARWDSKVRELLGWPDGLQCVHPEHGVTFERIKNPMKAGEYVLKMAMPLACEMTDQYRAKKRSGLIHRTPWQLLADIVSARKLEDTADGLTEEERIDLAADYKLWAEWEEGMVGRQMLVTTNGFWRWAGIADLEHDELAAIVAAHGPPEPPPPKFITMVMIPPWLWTAMQIAHFSTYVLEHAEAGGPAWKVFVKYCQRLWDPGDGDGDNKLCVVSIGYGMDRQFLPAACPNYRRYPPWYVGADGEPWRPHDFVGQVYKLMRAANAVRVEQDERVEIERRLIEAEL